LFSLKLLTLNITKTSINFYFYIEFNRQLLVKFTIVTTVFGEVTQL